MSHEAELRSLNLNLLPVLDALLRYRNVTRTAAALELTQSSVSASLKKLRLALDDELLVPVGRELVLTARARELMAPLGELMERLRGALFREEFGRADEPWRFTLACADYAVAALAPGLARLIEAERTPISVQFVHSSADSLAHMDEGRVDAIIGPRSVLSRTLRLARFAHVVDRTLLWTDVPVGIAREDSPLDVEDRGAFLAAPHVSFHVDQAFSESPAMLSLVEQEARLGDRVLTPHYLSIPWTVSQSDFVAVVPGVLARAHASLPLRSFTPPVSLPDIQMEMAWLRRAEGSAGHCWLRSAVSRAVSESELLSERAPAGDP